MLNRRRNNLSTVFSLEISLHTFSTDPPHYKFEMVLAVTTASFAISMYLKFIRICEKLSKRKDAQCEKLCVDSKKETLSLNGKFL